MARRNRNTDEAQEATVSTTTTEAPVENTEAPSTESTEAPAEDKASEAPIDLTEFNAAVDAAIEGKDATTGEVAPAFIEPVTKAYRALQGVKAKNAAKSSLQDKMVEFMNKVDIYTARAYLALSEAVKSAGGSTGGGSGKTPADPTEAYIAKYVTLRLALELSTVPEGVAEDWKDKAAALYKSSLESANGYVAWQANEAEDKGDAPEVSSIVKTAVKLSTNKQVRASGGGKASTPYTGERRDIAKHIQQAFDGLESGAFLTIAEIRNATSEEYGDQPPSAGAISARLFPKSGGKCTVTGVVPTTSDKGHKGAVKA